MVCDPTVQVRRNTEAAVAEARKAMLAGGQAHSAPARAAGQADVVAASQGITKSLLRSRQLMAQVCSSLEYNCSCLQHNAAGIQLSIRYGGEAWKPGNMDAECQLTGAGAYECDAGSDGCQQRAPGRGP
jgi:hypothetical protein